ncbi:MAG: F0F1 ATP synthase subunit epsilon [Phycisphaerae bacterium]|jgi:F-type H+-transporting ATPase subunit epsilon
MIGQTRFNCTLQTRESTPLECLANSVIVPGSEGQVGILRGHCPIVIQLGLGIMSAKGLVDSEYNMLEDRYFLLDGGFARIADNDLAVVAYDVISPADMEESELELLVQRARTTIETDLHSSEHKPKSVRKAELILRIVGMCRSASPAQ